MVKLQSSRPRTIPQESELSTAQCIQGVQVSAVVARVAKHSGCPYQREHVTPKGACRQITEITLDFLDQNREKQMKLKQS